MSRKQTETLTIRLTAEEKMELQKKMYVYAIHTGSRIHFFVFFLDFRQQQMPKTQN